MEKSMLTKIITIAALAADGSISTQSITVAFPPPTLQVRARLRSLLAEWKTYGDELDADHAAKKKSLEEGTTGLELETALGKLKIDAAYAVSDYLYRMNLSVLRTLAVRSAMTPEDVAALDADENDDCFSIPEVTDAVNSFRQTLGS